MYDKPVMHTAVRKLQEVCKQYDVLLSKAALRWLVFHSALGDGDGMILGGEQGRAIGAIRKDL